VSPPCKGLGLYALHRGPRLLLFNYLTKIKLLTTINRSAKISLALTIARLIPRCHPTHSASIIVAYLSTFIGIGIVIQTCVYCSRIDKTWTYVSPFRCRVTAAAGIVRLGCKFFYPLSFGTAEMVHLSTRLCFSLGLISIKQTLIIIFW